jgi:rhodanese-related sulfurtransferase
VWCRLQVSKPFALSAKEIIMAERIDARRAHERLESDPNALLVCAYEDEAEFHANYLDGAISLLELQSMEDALEKDREIILYCVCPNEETSSSVADEYRANGFKNVRVLKDGVTGWERAGYNVPTDPSEPPPVSNASETANRS